MNLLCHFLGLNLWFATRIWGCNPHIRRYELSWPSSSHPVDCIRFVAAVCGGWCWISCSLNQSSRHCLDQLHSWEVVIMNSWQSQFRLLMMWLVDMHIPERNVLPPPLPPLLARRHFWGGGGGGYILNPPCGGIFIRPPLLYAPHP